MGVEEKALGRRLQKARQRAGLTQQELCQKAGLSYSTLAKIERGAIRSPSVFTVAAIATATNTPLDSLLDVKTSSPALAAKKTSKTGVRFVYFDVNNVLVHAHQHAFYQIAEASGRPIDTIEALYYRHNDIISSGQMKLSDFNELMRGETGLPSFDWKEYYINNAKPMPGVHELLAWAAEHYEIGLLSNNMPGFIEEMINVGTIPNLKYRAVVDSSRVGCLKPGAQIFKIATKEAGVPDPEILLIDDTRANLTAADAAGWQIVWFNELDPAESIVRAKKYLEF